MLRALKEFSSPVFGNVSIGDRVDAKPAMATFLLENGLAEEIDSGPFPLGDGQAKPLSLSLVDPASPESKPSESEQVTTQESAEQSSLTQVSDSQDGQTSSTPVTTTGGEPMPEKSPPESKSGAALKKPPTSKA